MRRLGLLVAFILIMLMNSSSSYAESNDVRAEVSLMSWLTVTPSADSFYSLYIVERLEVGTRINYVVLLDDTRGQPNNGSFFGTVTQLREKQDITPAKLFLQYRIIPQFGVGLAFDRYGFDVGDWGVEGEGSGGPDGNATLSGPLLYVFGQYTNKTMLTPFCELGVAFYSASFDADSGWESSNNKSVELGNATGFFLGLGCDMKINEQFLIDLYGCYMSVSDLNGEWYLLGDKRGDVVLTPSHLSFGVGAKFVF